MRTSIVYHSRYGATANIAEQISTEIGAECTVRPCKKVDARFLEESDLIIIGGPIYAGSVSSKLIRFCERHKDTILQRKLGVFISCMYENDRAEMQLADSYPGWLISHAIHSEWLGGRVTIGSLNFLDRIIAIRLAGLRTDVDKIQSDRITDFVKHLAH